MTMLAAVLLFHSFQADLGPTLQPGANTAFYRLCLDIEDQLEQGKFDEAEKLALVLPRKDISYHWDDSAVQPLRRDELRLARDKALAAWGKSGLNLEFEEENRADISFSFVPTLPPNVDTDVPAGAVHFFSSNPEDPRLDTVLALKRGGKQITSESFDIYNEVAYAVAAYLGIQRTPVPGSFAFRSEEPVYLEMRGTAAEFMLARRNLEIAEVLRQAVRDKKRLVPTRPQIRVEPETLQLDPVVQGEKVKFAIQISNVGNAPLLLRVRPDCFCVSGEGPGTIEPGGSGLIEGEVDTSQTIGSLHKRYLVFSNDPDAPLKQIPILIHVAARYRLIGLDGPTLVMNEGSGLKTDVYLTFGPNTRFRPTAARVDGRPADVTWQAWSGSIADPELGEGPAPREGYKFTISFNQQGPPGRNGSTLVIKTDDEAYPEVRYSFYTQSGIVALPDQVFFGEIPRAPKRALFSLSRPGKPFSITKIECYSERVSVEWKPGPSDEHLLTVQLDGQMDYGNFNASMTLYTDDPAQPTVVVTLRAVVR